VSLLLIPESQCGQWAGATWAKDAECSAKAATCEEYAAQDPTAFVDAYCKSTLRVCPGMTQQLMINRALQIDQGLLQGYWCGGYHQHAR
jgi:hypothetical protein